MANLVEQVIAVDWSGHADDDLARESIWYCRVSASGDVELDYGLSRDELFGWLLAWKAKCGSMLVGLDFAFSFPKDFVRQNGGSVEAFWQHVAGGAGELWLKECPPPFYGRPATTSIHSLKQRSSPAYRVTDTLAGQGTQPKSPFQIAGAGQVGTASLRGIPYLPLLREQGFRIWPFHAPGPYTVAEIYPRYFTGPVVKSRSLARRRRLFELREEHPLYARLTVQQQTRAEMSEDAFDALVSGIEMWRRKEAVQSMVAEEDETTQLEGSIFAPPLVIEQNR
jgi:hypothetical protein